MQANGGTLALAAAVGAVGLYVVLTRRRAQSTNATMEYYAANATAKPEHAHEHDERAKTHDEATHDCGCDAAHGHADASHDCSSHAHGHDDEAPQRAHEHDHASPPPPPKPPPAPSGPPPLGAIIQLAKETGKPRKECKAALQAHAHDFEAAKAALVPPPEPLPDEPLPQASPAIAGIFEPSPKFAGGRPGWIYKRGQLGVGYYRDQMDVVLPKKG